jgi:hypothetical protein
MGVRHARMRRADFCAAYLAVLAQGTGLTVQGVSFVARATLNDDGVTDDGVTDDGVTTME